MGVIAIRVDDDLEARIRQAARNDGQNLSTYCKGILQQGLGMKPFELIEWKYIEKQVNNMPSASISLEKYNEMREEINTYDMVFANYGKKDVIEY